MPIFIAIKRTYERLHPPKETSLLSKYFDFFPAINIEHKTERTGAFVTLVLGYSVVALLFQNKAQFGINAFFGKAVLGLIQAFAFNWLYFEIDADNLHSHAIRRHYASALLWQTFHLPFIMAYVLAGAALSRLVLATDCRDANVDDITEAYLPRSEHEVSSGLRWFYCAGLGIAILSMSKSKPTNVLTSRSPNQIRTGIISLTHVHKEIDGQRLSKTARLILRSAVGITLICLSLAESLTSLTLVSTTTGLVVLVLIVDLYGSTTCDEPFWKCRRQCHYSADCAMRKKIVIDALKMGRTVNLSELQLAEDKEGHEKSTFEVCAILF